MKNVGFLFFNVCLCFLIPSFCFSTTHKVSSDYSIIQEAIEIAMDGDTILVAPGTYTGEGNREIEFLGKNVVVISEAGPEQTTIDGEGVGQYGFHIHQGEDHTALVQGFRIINVTGGTFFNTGGIYIEDASPTIRECIL